MGELMELARRHDSDKADHPHYLGNYEQHLGGRREHPIRLLELGIHRGGSLLLWRDYFPVGVIVGLDSSPAHIDDPSGRVRTYLGSQQDTALLDRIAAETAPEGFDVIIDDCSHIGVFARVSFWHLFDKHLKVGGVYVIEDWGTGYWDTFPDGVRFRDRVHRYQPRLHWMTMALTALRKHRTIRRFPAASRALAGVKALTLRGQYRSHGYGMVGFVKELIDEAGRPDITHAKLGSGNPQASKFRQVVVSHGQVFVFKA